MLMVLTHNTMTLFRVRVFYGALPTPFFSNCLKLLPLTTTRRMETAGLMVIWGM